MKFISSLLMVFGVLFSSCNKSDTVPNDPPLSECDTPVLIDSDFYQNGPADEFYYPTAVIEGNCLKMTVKYGGGCHDVVFQLVDSEAIMESMPIQRNIRLSLEDNDDCEAWVTQELNFDLTPLQVDGYSKIILNIEGLPESLTYQY